MNRWALVVLGVLGTCPSTALAFRTTRDDPAWPDAGIVRWENPPRSLVVFDQMPDGLVAVGVHDTILQAAAAWTVASCSTFGPSEVRLTRTHAASGDGVSTIEWLGAAWRDSGLSADVGATTDITYEQAADGSWRIIDADIYVNDLDFSWAVDPSNEADRQILPVIVHELGHVAGLLHVCETSPPPGVPACVEDSTLRESVMFPEYLGESQAALGPDDIAGSCFLYPRRGCDAVDCPTGTACIGAGQCAVTCGALVCRAGEQCVGGACTVEGCAGDACEPRSGCVATATEPCGAGLPGDPCAEDRDCETGLCIDGICRLACAADGACPPPYTCVDGWCEGDGAVFGDGCEHARDCTSRLCLREDDATTCTRSCDELADCPTGYLCGEASGQRICRAAPLSGCSVTHTGRSEGLSIVLLVTFVIVAARRRRGTH